MAVRSLELQHHSMQKPRPSLTLPTRAPGVSDLLYSGGCFFKCPFAESAMPCAAERCGEQRGRGRKALKNLEHSAGKCESTSECREPDAVSRGTRSNELLEAERDRIGRSIPVIFNI